MAARPKTAISTADTKAAASFGTRSADYAVIYTKKNIARHGGVELVKSSSMFDEAATMNVSLCRACGKGFFDLKSEIEQSE